ncbi:MAG: hypothetical protein RMZ41_003020 [Nostoc sp. DedVER02]|uniref:hypothetical protein n=1 Tax=unclassified Nostoc TaxID=2593658 RepID=UPI002AD48DDA|nr:MULTISPECIES: hypothetical protein [unclassified Nostoc]MDZ7986872.1 hypothetical protein [Nostoc sp. DedVER02]MDZ8115774.1 hypothetical protein [Nostoc sp. DedVER01b]
MTTFVKTDLNLFGLIPPDNITTHLRRCAADLLGLFKGWSSKEKPGYWFKARIKDLQDYLGGLYGKSSVSKAVKLLDELEIVRQHVNSKDGQIHTYYYEFVPQALEKLLQNQPSQAEAETPQFQVEASGVQLEASTLYTDPQDFDLSSSDPPLNECVGEEEMSEEEIQAAIAQSLGVNFETAVEQPPEPPTEAEPVLLEKPRKQKHDLTPFFNRLRTIDVPLTGQIREILTKHPEERLHKNITALEEEAAKNGLKNPIASCIAAITRNWIPKLDPQTWWDAAAKNLGREHRDALIQNVTKVTTPDAQQEVFVIYKTGRYLKLSDAYGMNWDEIASHGSATT